MTGTHPQFLIIWMWSPVISNFSKFQGDIDSAHPRQHLESHSFRYIPLHFKDYPNLNQLSLYLNSYFLVRGLSFTLTGEEEKHELNLGITTISKWWWLRWNKVRASKNRGWTIKESLTHFSACTKSLQTGITRRVFCKIHHDEDCLSSPLHSPGSLSQRSNHTLPISVNTALPTPQKQAMGGFPTATPKKGWVWRTAELRSEF